MDIIGLNAAAEPASARRRDERASIAISRWDKETRERESKFMSLEAGFFSTVLNSSHFVGNTVKGDRYHSHRGVSYVSPRIKLDIKT